MKHFRLYIISLVLLLSIASLSSFNISASSRHFRSNFRYSDVLPTHRSVPKNSRGLLPKSDTPSEREYRYSISAPYKLTQYRYSSTRNQPDQVAYKNSQVWSNLGPHGKDVGTIYHLTGSNHLLHLHRFAYLPNSRTRYYNVIQQGRDLGWISYNSLRRPHTYLLPYRYTSQFWPKPSANDACEVAALKMALSVKGKANHDSLYRMVKRVPRSKHNPDKGYTKNPFKYGSGATIYPHALAKVAKHYGVHAKSVTNHKHQIRYFESEIERGNPIVFEGSYLMKDTNSDHSLVLLGYKPNYFYWADPLSKRNHNELHGWTTIRNFERLFYTKLRGHRAMVISYKF